MEPSFNKQVFSASLSTRLSLLHGLKKVLSVTNYSLGAVYETIDGPYCFGDQRFEAAQDRFPILTLLGGERAVGKHAKAQRHRKGSLFYPEDLFAQSGIPSEEAFCADDLAPMNVAFGPNGLHSPATYLVYIDILADADSHRALHAIGSAEFHLIPGWLSESIFQSGTSYGARSPMGMRRYVCMQAFDHRSDMDQVSLVLQEFVQGTLAQGTGYANIKIRTYKLFGSVGRGL